LLPGQDLLETASIKSTIGTNRYGRETNDEETIEHRFAARNRCEIKEEKRGTNFTGVKINGGVKRERKLSGCV